MKTYLLKETETEDYYKFVIKTSQCLEEAYIKTGIMGLPSHDVTTCECLEEVKASINVGDCLLVEYDGKLLPFQCIHRYSDNRCVFSSYYVLDNHIFDEKTNVWRDSSIRKYMNEDMAKKFDPELVSKYVKETEVHTDDYVTKDKFWLLSHEEIGYKDENNMFKKNVGTICFDYYKDADKEDKGVA